MEPKILILSSGMLSLWDRSKCDFCGECLLRCPYMEFTPDGAKEEMRKLVEGESLYVARQCITCGACNQYCEKGANPFDLIINVQEATGAFNASEQAVAMMAAASELPSEIISGQPGKPVMSLCVVGDVIPHLFEGRLFEGMTFLKGGDYFCLIGWLHVGRETPVREGARRVINKLAELRTEEIIFFHDDCYALVTTKAKEYGIDVPFRPVHLIEYLYRYLKENEDEVRRIEKRIAFQPSCASRIAYEYPPWKGGVLDELFELIGVERVDRKYDRMNGLCCGAPVSLVDKARADEIKNRNIKDAVDAGAEIFVFTCPFCALNLRRRVREAGMEPYMLSNLCRLALGEELPGGGCPKL